MITVLGARGFIGSHLVAALQAAQTPCFAPERDDPAIFQQPLGHVIYCIGLTADFRSRPFATVRAHVEVLNRLLEHGNFASLTYLSSTRVYARAETACEDQQIPVLPSDPSDLYNISKLMGESLCLGSGVDRARVVRLSNVLGRDFQSDNLVMALIREGVGNGVLRMNSAADSSKDFVLIDDVVAMLPKIACFGRQRCYNLGTGRNLSFAEIAAAVAGAVGCDVEWRADAPCHRFPTLSMARLADEMGFVAGDVLAAIPQLVEDYRRSLA